VINAAPAQGTAFIRKRDIEIWDNLTIAQSI